ncbi:TetR/AcrR family transcriptional regulator [Dictyobacter kobayashii]|uniref:TetR family transcriptional regulator n=1 Tax=Dictyobacter kobayashii TaxID=2014872 RepID=A0A402AR79_9CHLR|nr:TetR/AcrR family transcriptional regulator [Dictyobacter kobayashii]GCE21598.1 TetR family transcriptional regulator [Dictyobacter kobayashii]
MSQDARKKGEPREAGETRRQILQAAQHLFAAHGYRAVTTRQIAEACGITQPALYKHFGDKQDLYVSMLLGEVAQVKTALERIVQREAPIPERLRLTALYLLNNTRHDIGMMTHDMSTELSQDRQHILEHAFVDGLVQPIAALFEEGMRQGLMRLPGQDSVSPQMAALLFLNIIDLFTAQSFQDMAAEPRRSKTEQARLIVQLSLYGMAQRQERLDPL